MNKKEIARSLVMENHKKNKGNHSDHWELAMRIADMHDLWEERDGQEELPEWLIEEARDVYYGIR